MQPQSPIVPVNQPDPNMDFTAQGQTPQYQQTPVVPQQPDSTITQLQSDISEIKNALGTFLQAPATPEPAPAPTEQKKYDDWGTVFNDVKETAKEVVQEQFTAAQTQAQAQDQALQQQEAQNQQLIDGTLSQLRQAGYLPPVTNQFDPNDPGKRAEQELIAYAVYGVGSSDLVKTAQELKFRHDSGFSYDPLNKNFVQMNQPSGNPNEDMFGNFNQPNAPQQFAQGPVNPYAPRYPAGFNAPVNSGASYPTSSGQAPTLRQIRGSSYSDLVKHFSATN